MREKRQVKSNKIENLDENENVVGSLTVRHPAVFARLALAQLARFARQEALARTRRHRAPDRLFK